MPEKTIPVLPPQGGDAFPTVEFMDEVAVGTSRGVTARDYFAAAAAQGYIASFAGADAPTPKPERVAALAYQIADAMIAERKRTIEVPAPIIEPDNRF